MESNLLQEKVLHPISSGELERRWRATREIMKEERIDFLIIQNNNGFVGGYLKWFTDMQADHGYPAAAIFPAADEMTTVFHGAATEPGPAAYLLRGVKKRMQAPVVPALNYTCSYDAERVVEELRGYKNCRLSFVNEGAMLAGFPTYIRKHLTGATFVDITERIDEIKAVKSPEEIEHIKESAHIHDEAFKACLEAIRPGMREFELAAIAKFNCFKLGSEQALVLMGSAPSGSPCYFNNPHAFKRELKSGDQVSLVIEVSGPGGYWTHLHRTVVLGKIPEELLVANELAKEVQALTLRMLKPGADPMEILNANNEFLRSRGCPEDTRIYCHGQGYDVVERPSFQPGETMKIKAGMNIGVHPWVFMKKASSRICDNYMVTETGVSECLHKTPKEVFSV
jgi:Xaa-Pro aminopeptidase